MSHDRTTVRPHEGTAIPTLGPCGPRWCYNGPVTQVSPTTTPTIPTVAPAPGVDTGTAPRTEDPTSDDHERMAHIVLEGFRPEGGDYVSAGPTVVEGIVNGTAVRALCGKVWVPGRDPKRYPLCPTCKEIAEGMGWKLPNT